MWFRLPRPPERPHRPSARHALIIAGVIVGTVLAIGAATLIAALRHQTLAAAARQLDSLALVLAEATDRGFQAAELLQTGLIQSMQQDGIDTPEAFDREMSTPAVNQDLKHRIAGMPQIIALALVDRQGRLINASNGLPGSQLDLSDREFFRVLSGDPARLSYISPPLRDRLGGTWMILLSRVMGTVDQALLGIVDVLLDLEGFEQLYSRIASDDGTSVGLFRQDGVLLARSPRIEPTIGKSYAPNPDFASLLAAVNHGVVQRASMVDGEQRLIAPRRVAHFPLVIAVTRTMRAVLVPWWRETLWLGSATGVAELALGVLVLLGVRRVRDQDRLNGAYAAALEAEAGRVLAESELALAHEQDQRAQDARRQALRFNDAADSMQQGLLMVDGAERVLVGNRRMKEIFGIPQAVAIADRSIDELTDLIITHGAITREEFVALRAWRGGMRARQEADSFTWELHGGRAVTVTHQPREEGWLATYEDVTERRKADAQMAYLAQHDALTDLPNRRVLRERLEQALAFVRRGRLLALLCLDLDQFKAVNDTLGHPIGDALLQAVANRLRAHIRETDIVARLGGDEFAIVQTALDRVVEAGDFAERLITLLEAPFTIEGHQIVIGTSIGLALAPQDGTDPDTLLKNADLALYRAKQDGRGVCRMFQTDMDAAMQIRRTLELDLRLAQRGGQLELFFQPLINLRARGVAGFEALLRWRHPERGLVSPAAFIPLAEEIGVIIPMGEWVVRRACATAAHWPDGLKVAVNLSPVQFKSRTLVEMVAAALRESGLAPERLELEITETVMLQDTETTLATLHALHGLGVRIALDDFGTGYSSLSYLRRFPFDRIKIDQSFVRELGGPRDCSAIVRAVVQLSRDLGMATTAEGVETPEQLRQLAAAGCTDIQGYLFSRPVPGPAIRELLRTLPSVDELLSPAPVAYLAAQ